MNGLLKVQMCIVFQSEEKTEIETEQQLSSKKIIQRKVK